MSSVYTLVIMTGLMSLLPLHQLARAGEPLQNPLPPQTSYSPQQEWTPVPDPTRQTTAALQREIAGLRELFVMRIEALDKATMLLQQRADREPSISVVAAQLSALKEIITEKFKGVDIQFTGVEKQFFERDTRTDQMAQATKTAIDAALSAAKENVLQQNTSFAEATRKAELGTKERLDQLTTLFQTETRGLATQLVTVNKSLEDKITSITSRLGLIEGSGVGANAARETQDTSTTMLLGIIGAIVGLAGLGLAITLALRRPHA